MKLRLILGDQLSHTLSSLSDIDVDNDLIWMCEVWDEVKYCSERCRRNKA